MSDVLDEWDDSICWYCKSRDAVEDSKYEFNLHRVIKRKSTYIVVGMTYSQEYEKAKSWVPRCKHCQRIHDHVKNCFLIPWVIGTFLASRSVLSDPDIDWNNNLFTQICAVILLAIMCAVPVGLLIAIVDSFWKSDQYGLEHPRIKALSEEGWNEGKKPPYKW